MTDNAIDELMKEVANAVRRAYALGREQGASDVRASIAATLGMALGAPAEQAALEDKKRKAPKGLLEATLKTLLATTPGLSQSQVEEGVRRADDRIAVKSIYNHLKLKEGSLYRKEGDRWFLFDAPRHAPVGWASSPQGETGGFRPPASTSPVSESAEAVASGSKGVWGT